MTVSETLALPKLTQTSAKYLRSHYLFEVVASKTCNHLQSVLKGILVHQDGHEMAIRWRLFELNGVTLANTLSVLIQQLPMINPQITN